MLKYSFRLWRCSLAFFFFFLDENIVALVMKKHKEYARLQFVRNNTVHTGMLKTSFILLHIHE